MGNIEPSFNRQISVLKEQGAPQEIIEIYSHAKPDFFVCKDEYSRYIYSDFSIANASGYQKPEHLLGLDPNFINAPLVECADLFITEDKITFNTKKNYYTMGDFQHADSRHQTIYSKKIVYDSRLKKNILVLVGYEMNHSLMETLVSLLQSSFKHKFLFKKNKVHYTSYSIVDYELENPLTKQETICLFYLLRGKTG